MITNNKIEKAFGPVGTSAGVFMFIVGLFMTYSSISGLILVLLGAFVGFTSTTVFIDFDNKRVRLSNNLFGIIKTGQWRNIEPDMKLGLKKSDLAWRAFSRGNRALDIDSEGYLIILYNANGKEIMPVKRIVSLAAAKEEMKKLSEMLGLSL